MHPTEHARALDNSLVERQIITSMASLVVADKKEGTGVGFAVFLLFPPFQLCCFVSLFQVREITRSPFDF